MVDASGEQLENEVAQKVLNSGFHVVKPRASSLWSRTEPDLIVERSGKRVAVEVKARPLMLSDISKVKRYRLPGRIGVLLCVPDDALSRTPDSVRSYAEQLDIQLCRTEEVGEVLQKMFG